MKIDRDYEELIQSLNGKRVDRIKDLPGDDSIIDDNKQLPCDVTGLKDELITDLMVTSNTKGDLTHT